MALPMASYNGDQGLGVGGELLWMKISGSEWSMRGGGFYSFGYSTGVFGVSLQNRKLFDWLYFSTGLMYAQTDKGLFYGYGPLSSLEGPSQYSMKTTAYDFKLGFNMTEHSVIGVGYGASDVSVGRGSRTEETQYVDRYVGRPFVEGSSQGFLKTFLMYDSLAPEFAPQEGTRAIIEYQMGNQNSPEISKAMAGVTHYLQIYGNDFLVVLRGKWDRTWGGDNPFYSQSRLGGTNTLRGYKGGRWTDFASVLYGAEARWAFLETSGWFSRWELNFGYETGRVFNDGAINVLFDELRPTYVVGLTAVLSSGAPVRLDVANSPEGNQFFLHLLYPF